MSGLSGYREVETEYQKVLGSESTQISVHENFRSLASLANTRCTYHVRSLKVYPGYNRTGLNPAGLIERLPFLNLDIICTFQNNVSIILYQERNDGGLFVRLTYSYMTTN